MKEVTGTDCTREQDLIGFLYGELNEAEVRSFQRHLKDCDSCNSELEAFGNVRASIVAWRNESLGGLVSGQITEKLEGLRYQKPSALAALREFFNLSPLWMKGAVAFVSLLFCLFVGLAIVHWREKQPAPVVTNPGGYSQQELNALVGRRVQEELQRQKLSAGDKTATAPDALSAGLQTSPRVIAKRGSGVSLEVASQKARRPLSRTEREQLASDLRLVPTKTDGDFDLLDDRINQ